MWLIEVQLKVLTPHYHFNILNILLNLAWFLLFCFFFPFFLNAGEINFFLLKLVGFLSLSHLFFEFLILSLDSFFLMSAFQFTFSDIQNLKTSMFSIILFSYITWGCCKGINIFANHIYEYIEAIKLVWKKKIELFNG